MKKILNKIYCSKLTAFFIHKIILFLCYTNYRKIIGHEHIQKLYEQKKPFIISFWHGRLLPMSTLARSRDNINIIISKHSDGEFIANVMEQFSLKAIRGSSNRPNGAIKGWPSKDRGGVAVVKESLKVLKNGGIIVITPDGPKGPRMRYKNNIFGIAQKAGVPIVNVAYSATNSIVMKTWDRFMIPLPFGKIITKISEPIYIPADYNAEELEIAGKNIEKDLNMITQELDLLCNKTPVMPDI